MHSNILDTKTKKLTESELAEVKEIEVACRLSSWTLADYSAEFEREDSIFLIAEYGERLSGFLLARLTGDGFSAEADLLNFGVLESFRNRKIGSALYESFIDELAARNVKTVWLEVRRSNEIALSFYLKRGFEMMQIRKNFYSNPSEDALVLKLEISVPPEMSKPPPIS